MKKWNRPVFKRFGSVIVKANIDEINFGSDGEEYFDLDHYLVLEFLDARTGKFRAWTDFRGRITVALPDEGAEPLAKRIRKSRIEYACSNFELNTEIWFWCEDANNAKAGVTEMEILQVLAETGRDYEELYDEMAHLFWEGIPDSELYEACIGWNKVVCGE